jgi:hypothetical protein
MSVKLFQNIGKKSVKDPSVFYSLDLVAKDNFTEEYKNKLVEKRLGIASLVEINNDYLLLLERLSDNDCTFEQ